jgi:four helix bundle protein
MSYRNLEIWKLAREVVIEVHEMTLQLPKFEMFEEGQQISRSTKTTKACIVEGYSRRRYKQEWIKFLVYSLSSNDGSMYQLENIWDTKSLSDEIKHNSLHQKIEISGKKLNNF